MSDPPLARQRGPGRYRPVWSVRPVRRAFAGALVARTAQTMLPLTLLLLYRQRTGTFTEGGLAVALFSLAFVAGGPVTARLAGLRRTRLLVVGLVNAASLVILASAVSPALSWAAVAAAGTTVPPLTAALRSTFVTTLPERDRPAAFSLDAIATELLFVAGPVLVSAAAVLGSTADALFVAAALVLGGCALMPSVAGQKAPAGAALRGSDGKAVMLPWLAIGAALMAGTGFIEVAATARTTQFGHPAASGTVLAVWAAGSIAGGLVYGSRDWPGPATTQLRVLLVLLGAGFAAVSAAGNIGSLYPLMFAAGLASSPAVTALVTGFGARTSRTESFAWLSSATSLGGSIGYAVAGVLLAHATITFIILIGAAIPAAAGLIVPRIPAAQRHRADGRP